MKRGLLLLALAAQSGCGVSTAPSPLYPTYFLWTVDGKPLPVPFGPEGSMLVASLLDFGNWARPRQGSRTSGTVRQALDIRLPDQSIQHSETGLNYVIEADTLRINLCPPLALCLISSELVGPITDRADTLVLTYYLGGRPVSVYRFNAAMRD